MTDSASHTERLIKWWARLGESGPHPDDRPHLVNISRTGRGSMQWDRLLPVPFVGSLREARMIIVMLNPGYNASEQEDDEQHERALMHASLRQEPNATFWPLTITQRTKDGKEPGSRKYWRSVFGSYVAANAALYGGEEELYAAIARTVCVVQLVPYHSTSAPPQADTAALPSAIAMADWVLTESQSARRPVLIFRGWGYLNKALRVKTDNWSHVPFVNETFLRRPSFNPNGKISALASSTLTEALSQS